MATPRYLHQDEGPTDMSAHAKSSMVGVSLTIPITNRRLNLGTWEGIYLCEFREGGGSQPHRNDYRGIITLTIKGRWNNTQRPFLRFSPIYI